MRTSIVRVPRPHPAPRRRFTLFAPVVPILSPGGIASGFAAGTAFVANTQILSPGGIASGFAAGTPFVDATVAPGGLASGFAAGTPFVAPEWILAPSGIASGFAAGSPDVEPEQFIDASGIASGVRIGVPLVAGGVLLPDGIASGFAAGLPAVFPSQLLSPDGITSSFAAGLPILREVQTIQPSGIGSGFAAGTPLVKGAVLRVLIHGGIGPGDVGVPTIVGGSQLFKLFISGIDVTNYVKVETPGVASQTIGRWTMNWDLFTRGGADLSWIDVGQPVLAQEFGVKIFAGCIQEVTAVPPDSTPNAITYHVVAVDKSGICDRRLVAPTVFPAAADGADVIRAIVSSSLDGEGITTGGVPAVLGALGADLPLTWVYVTNAFDQIATLTGTVWWVDVQGVLNFSPLTELEQAPFEITDTSSNYRHFTVRRTLADYRNRQVVVSNLTILPGGGTTPVIAESYVFGPNGQAEAFNAGLAFGYVLVTQPIRAVLSLKINGVSKDVFSIFDANAPAYGSVEAWYYFGGGPGGANVVFPGIIDIASGDTIEISYVPFVQNSSVSEGEALIPTIPPGATLRSCGSGRYEAVEQVHDISLRADLDALAQAILDRQGGIPTIVSFEIDLHGAAPGKLVRVDRPDVGLVNRQMMITSVTGKSLFADLGHRCSFRWQVEARSNHDPGNATKWYERLVRRTEQAKPLARTEFGKWVISPDGAAVAAGVPIGNPNPVVNTGKMSQLTIQCGVDPPVDQNIVVQLFDNGISLGTVTLPANAAPNFQFVFDFPDANPLYVFQGDNLTITVSYQVTGLNPVQGSNITFAAAWQY